MDKPEPSPSALTTQRRVWPNDYMTETDDHGVRCPKCNCPRTRVIYTRHSIGGRNHRRRECENCKDSWGDPYRFSTYERIAK